MSLPSAYTSLLNELNRDIIRASPSDPLQYCANWFFQKLEQDRIRNLNQQSNPTTTTTTTTNTPLSYLPSTTTHQEIYSHHPLTTYTPTHHFNQIPIQLAYSPVLNPSYSPNPLPVHPHTTHHIAPQTYINPFQAQVQPTQFVTSQPIYQTHPIHLDSNHVAPPPPSPHHHHHHHDSPSNAHQHHSPRPAIASGEQRAYSFGHPSSTPTHQRIGPTEHHPHSPPQPHPHHHLHPPPPPPPPSHHHHHHSPSHHQSRPPSRITGGTPNHDRLISQPAHGTAPHSEISPRAASATMPHQRGPDQRVKPPSSSSSEEASDESDSAEPPMVPSGYNFGRRTSVSAESLSPSNLASGPSLPKVVIPKTIEQRSRIESSIKENLLFRNLDEEQYNDVLNAMSELKVSLGTEVIVQGGVGDFFYVVEEGTFDVYVGGPATYTYVPPIANGATGTLSLPLDQQSQQDPIAQRGQTPVGGTTVTHQAPAKKVHSYGPGGSFGELALMYNAPRAATVVATSQSATLWALDRVTFRSILMEHTSRKRKMYESFLSTVPILASLTAGERSKIADSLEERTINEGVEVVKEGEIGREFYIIESGRVEVTKKREGDESEVVGSLGKGDHFGELALLNSAPRAATVTAIGGRLRVAALGEKAFTRLLGPVIEILSRHAESHYGQSSIKRKTSNHPLTHHNHNNQNGPGTFGNWGEMGNGNHPTTTTTTGTGLVGSLNGSIGPTATATGSNLFQDYRLDHHASNRPNTSSSSSSIGHHE